MKDLKMFLEHRTINEVKFKCEKTGEEMNPEYTVYDKESLDDFIKKYKLNKEQFEHYSFYFAQLKGNHWVVKTNTPCEFNIIRMNDKFLSTGTIDYSYDDVITLTEDGDTMLVITK